MAAKVFEHPAAFEPNKEYVVVVKGVTTFEPDE